MPRATRRWSPARCLAVGSLSLGLVVGFVGAAAGLAAAQPRAAGLQAGANQFFFSHWRSTVKGTVAASPAPTSSSFVLDVAGCSSPQTITTTSSTTYSEPGTGLTPTGVAAGEKVIVQLVRGASTLTAGQVAILLTQISGKVDSASASQLLVTDQQGFQRTIALDVDGSTTVYFPTGSTVASGDLVNAFGTVDSDHVALDAVAVHVRSAPTSTTPRIAPPSWPDHLSGVVGPVTPGASFVLAEADGTTQIITTTSSTKYFASGSSSPPTGVSSGEHVLVALVPGATTPTAKSVFIVLTELNGTVVSVGSTSFVLQDSQGFWRTVDVGVGTSYSPSGTTLSGLTGDHVVAFGTVDPDLTDLDALFVDVLPTAVSSWFNTQLWRSVASGCPVTPQAWTAFATAGDPHPAGDVDPQAASASTSTGGWSSGRTSASTSGGAWNDPHAAASFSAADHANADPGSISDADGGHGSFPGSPGGPGNSGPQGGGGGGSGDRGPSGGPGGGR